MLNENFYDKREDINGKFNMKIECYEEDVEDIKEALKQVCIVTEQLSEIENISYTFRKCFHVNCEIKENIIQLNPNAKGSTNEIKVQLMCFGERYENVRNALSKIFYIKKDLQRKSNREKIYLILRFKNINI